MFANASVVNEIVTILIEYEHLLRIPPEFDSVARDDGQLRHGMIINNNTAGGSVDIPDFSSSVDSDISSSSSQQQQQHHSPLPPIPHQQQHQQQPPTTTKFGTVGRGNRRPRPVGYQFISLAEGDEGEMEHSVEYSDHEEDSSPQGMSNPNIPLPLPPTPSSPST